MSDIAYVASRLRAFRTAAGAEAGPSDLPVPGQTQGRLSGIYATQPDRRRDLYITVGGLVEPLNHATLVADAERRRELSKESGH